MSQATFREFLKEASAAYREGLGARLARIEVAWSALAKGASAELAGIERELHSIAGSAETFGMPGAGRAARAAESLVARWRGRDTTPTAAQRARFEALLDALRRAARGG
jgi:chemotaxis protein histidine kinase CheA